MCLDLVMVVAALAAIHDIASEGVTAIGEGEEPMMASTTAVVVEVAVEMNGAENGTKDGISACYLLLHAKLSAWMVFRACITCLSPCCILVLSFHP